MKRIYEGMFFPTAVFFRIISRASQKDGGVGGQQTFSLSRDNTGLVVINHEEIMALGEAEQLDLILHPVRERFVGVVKGSGVNPYFPFVGNLVPDGTVALCSFHENHFTAANRESQGRARKAVDAFKKGIGTVYRVGGWKMKIKGVLNVIKGFSWGFEDPVLPMFGEKRRAICLKS